MTRRESPLHQAGGVPFTPSHVAAILPFAKTPLLPAALVIGSMAPDLFFYIPLPIPRDFTHSWLGVVTVDLGFGILFYLLWELVFRKPVVDFTPLPARRRIAAMMLRSGWAGLRPPAMSWPAFVVVLAASVLIGTATHVIWDDFTHYDWVVQQLPWLRQQWGSKPVYKWAQYFSSVFGAVVVLIWTAVWWRRTKPADAPRTRLSSPARIIAWATVVAAGLATSLAIWISGIVAGTSPLDDILVFRTVTVGIAAAGLVALLWCLVWWLLRVRSTEVPQ
jgi:hypothetical protein